MRCRSLSLSLSVVSVVVLFGCNGSSPATDAGPVDAGAPDAAACHADTDCDDGRFCSGTRRCIAGAATADARGCVVLATPCTASQICDEAMRRCVTTCTGGGDGDGDGHAAVDCGGDDCDDSDPNRYPGNPEVCDAADHDEDCDPTTFGVRDADGDGYPDAACCNVGAAGMRVCGTDCADDNGSIHPMVPDLCNGIDDNCNGVIDEGGSSGTFYADCDGDGYGATGATGVTGCMPTTAPPECGGTATAGWATNQTDCDDARSAVHPTALEACDGLDDDCSGLFDGPGEDDDGDGYADHSCGGDDCDDACATCHPGGGPELCDGHDQDCNGMVDDGVSPSLMTTYYRDLDGDGAGDTATTTLACVPPTGYVATGGDCNDAENRTGVCAAPLHCTADRVCGCVAALWNDADYFDIDTGTVHRGAPNSADDLLDHNGTLAMQYIQYRTGVTYRHLSPGTFVAVDASYESGLTSTLDAVTFGPPDVLVVRSNSGVHYKLGFPTYGTYMGAGAEYFTYAPIDAAPAGFACMM